MTLEVVATPFAPHAPLNGASLAAARSLAIDPSLAPAFVASGRGSENRDRLLKGALCVTTGQQPGLFTGPLFTIYKGLSAVALAAQLQDELDRPVVPVFWVAGDDHDLAEANHLHILTVGNEVERLAARERDSAAAQTPLYREPLGPDVTALLGRLRDVTPETEFRDGVLDWLSRHYQPHADFATAFTEALAELLGPFGVVLFSPTHAAAKRAMAPLMLRALERGEELNDALAAAAGALERAPVTVGDGAALVMVEGELGRDRLVLERGGFTARRSGARWGLADLEKMAADEPERLSPNVLLRPVVEAALLPTLAYVGGPGELAYLPQCAPVYRELGVRAQVAVPRWSGRILEARVAKVLEKYGILADDLARPEGQLEAELVRDDMPPQASEALEALRQALDREYGRLTDAATKIDPTLKKTVQNAKGSAFKELGHLEKRILSHLKKENEIVLQQLAKARANLFPLGKPQERVFGVAQYLVRYGPQLLEDVLDAAKAGYRPLESGAGRP